MPVHVATTEIMPPDPAVAAMAASVDDPRQFEVVFEQHVDQIFRYAAMRVGAQAAEDVVAETFATAFTRRAAFRAEQGSVRPWLYGIAAVHLLRRRDQELRWLEQCARGAALEAPGGGDEDEAADSAVSSATARMLRPRIARALERIPDGERDVLLLHAVAGLTHLEIAAALGIRKGTAKVRLSRATTRLRAMLHDLDPMTQGAPR